MKWKPELDRYFLWLAIGIVVGWLTITIVSTQGAIYISSGDGQRDSAIVYNILRGNILRDPAYKGERAWYPPLMHLYYAGIQRVTKIPVQMLLSRYTWLVSFPSVLMVFATLYALSRSFIYVVIGISALLLFIPWTQELYIYPHPLVFGFGICSLALLVYAKAATSGRWRYFILSAFAIAALIYSQTILALSFCAGITLFQVMTRNHWKKFLIMVFLSFLFVSPYLIPLITIYKLIPKNAAVYVFSGIYNADTVYKLLNYYFYGFGFFRWMNSFFILSAIAHAVIKRQKTDLIVVSIYGVSLLMVLPSVGNLFHISLPLIPKFAPHDFQIVNHFIVVFLYTRGVWVWIEIMSHRIRTRRFVPEIVVLLFLAANIYSVLPAYQTALRERYTQLIEKNSKEADWLEASNWINAHTNISDVFLATPDRSYFFVSGFTGRKVVATHGNFANAFVDQVKRVQDLTTLYSTEDFDEFSRLVRYYSISYIIVSPYEVGLMGNSNPQKFEKYPNLRKTYTTGAITIYKVL